MRSSGWAYVIVGAFCAFFAYEGLSSLFNPHRVGYAAKPGHVHRFDDNGDRFIYAMGNLIIAGMGVAGMLRMARSDRKEAEDRRWSWQVAVDRQVFPRLSANVDMIGQDMNAFDGKLDYGVLLDQDTRSSYWCYGEPDRRVVEANLFVAPLVGRFIVARRGCADTAVVSVQAHQTVEVAACYVLTAAQALEILLAFRAGRSTPPDFALVPRQDPTG